MTTTLELPDEVIKEAMLRAGTDAPQEAVVRALREYTRPRSQKDLIRILGTFSDDFMSTEELNEMREAD